MANSVMGEISPTLAKSSLLRVFGRSSEDVTGIKIRMNAKSSHFEGIPDYARGDLNAILTEVARSVYSSKGKDVKAAQETVLDLLALARDLVEVPGKKVTTGHRPGALQLDRAKALNEKIRRFIESIPAGHESFRDVYIESVTRMEGAVKLFEAQRAFSDLALSEYAFASLVERFGKKMAREAVKALDEDLVGLDVEVHREWQPIVGKWRKGRKNRDAASDNYRLVNTYLPPMTEEEAAIPPPDEPVKEGAKRRRKARRRRAPRGKNENMSSASFPKKMPRTTLGEKAPH